MINMIFYSLVREQLRIIRSFEDYKDLKIVGNKCFLELASRDKMIAMTQGICPIRMIAENKRLEHLWGYLIGFTCLKKRRIDRKWILDGKS